MCINFVTRVMCYVCLMLLGLEKKKKNQMPQSVAGDVSIRFMA